MTKNLSTLFIIITFQLLSLPVFAGKCTGSAACSACSSCSSCKHCAKKGGTCGVCSPDDGSTGSSSFPGKAVAIGAGAVGVAYFVGRGSRKK